MTFTKEEVYTIKHCLTEDRHRRQQDVDTFKQDHQNEQHTIAYTMTLAPCEVWIHRIDTILQKIERNDTVAS